MVWAFYVTANNAEFNGLDKTQGDNNPLILVLLALELIDKGLTAYDAWQLEKAIREGRTDDAKALAGELGIGLATEVIPGNKILLKLGKKDKLADETAALERIGENNRNNPTLNERVNQRGEREVANKTPFGFKDASDFQGFSKSLNTGFKNAGVDDAQVLFQGSAVTGKKFTTGEAFDVGRVSDFDIAISSPQLLQRAKAGGIPLRSQGGRTRPLNSIDLEKLGLSDLSRQLSQQANRPVNSMIFNSIETAIKKAPNILVPK